MFGLADYYTLTNDRRAEILYLQGATAVADSFPAWRVPGDVSYYCAEQYCWDTDWRPASYHEGVAGQLAKIGTMLEDDEFMQRAHTLLQDTGRL